MPRGGARANSGPKKKLLVGEVVTKQEEARNHSGWLYTTIVAQPAPTPDEIATGKRKAEPYEITLWRAIIDADGHMLFKLYEHWKGRAVNTINHLHDKQIDTANVSISERMRIAREKAKARVVSIS